MQLDSPPLEESYQQYHQLLDLQSRYLVTVIDVVGEHTLNIYAQQKMLCTLHAIEEATTVYSASLPQLQWYQQSTPIENMLIQLTQTQ